MTELGQRTVLPYGQRSRRPLASFLLLTLRSRRTPRRGHGVSRVFGLTGYRGAKFRSELSPFFSKPPRKSGPS